MSRTLVRVSHERLDPGFHTRVLYASGDGPPIVLLHGFSDTADTWRRVLRRLAAQQRAAVAIDLPGHGSAGPIQPVGGLLPQFVRAAAAVVRRYGAGEPLVVAGNSLGGMTALLLGQHHPELVAGVMPIGPAGFCHPLRLLESADPHLVRGAFAALNVLGRLPARPQTLIYSTVSRLGGFGQPWRAPRGWVAAFGTRWSDHLVRSGMQQVLTALVVELQPSPYELTRVTAPVCVLWGSRDRAAPVRGATLLAEQLPTAECLVLPGIGHLAQLEAPDQITAYLTAFADSIGNASTARTAG